jgi:uncharacterized membrane protein YcaP (DUF421 family)
MYEWLISQDMMNTLFHLGAPLAEKILRPAIVYFALILLVRIFGKRELAQLNPFDLVVLLVLSETVQNAMIGDDNSITGAVVGAFSLLGVNYLVVRFLFRHRKLERIVEGSSRVLIRHGRVDKKALEQEALTEAELKSALHKQGFDSIDEVEQCTLEPGGEFHITRKQPAGVDVKHEELLKTLAELRSKVDQLLERQAG